MVEIEDGIVNSEGVGIHGANGTCFSDPQGCVNDADAQNDFDALDAADAVSRPVGFDGPDHRHEPVDLDIADGACELGNAADLEHHFPGATLIDDEQPHGTFAAANGQHFCNDGHFKIPFRSYNGHDRSIDFLNAKVSMPIMSVKKWNKNGNRTIFDDEFGRFVQKATGEEDYFISRNGVYFTKMFVKTSLLMTPADTSFRRPGQE